MQGRTQKPLMQVSMPHCCDDVQACEPGGTGRHVPARHMFPEPHCELLVQTAGGRRVHTPLWQVQLSWQSESSEQDSPGHPKVQSVKSPSVLMMVQPLAARIGTSNARLRSEFNFMGLSWLEAALPISPRHFRSMPTP